MSQPRVSACSFRFAPVVERLDGDAGNLALAEALSRLRTRRRPVLLDSASGAPRTFSLLAFDPLENGASDRWDSIADLRASVAGLEAAPTPTPPFFAGGFLGALAYDLGVEGEAPIGGADPWAFPQIVGGLYVDYLVRDHARAETWLVLGEEPGDARPTVAERRAAILAALARPHSAARARARAANADAPLERSVTAAEFIEQVERVRAEIARGEVYQANLSYRVTRAVDVDPVDLYLALRERHPGPYLGFVGFDSDDGPAAILSGSPELLLDYRPGSGAPAVAATRPIKGTAPRGASRAEDDANAARLLTSEKDRAELAMIVDLERNDLGRVALPGGVSVVPFPELESYATVHHLVANVDARIDPRYDGFDVLASLFPGGSITGAPKLRSMEIIADIEREGRGFAYGSMLMAGSDGRLLANILIRTLLWRARPGEVCYRVGGGITWPSDAAAEEREAIAKGAALAETVAAVGAPVAEERE